MKEPVLGMWENTAEQIEKGLVYDRVRIAYARARAQAIGGWLLREGRVEVWACPFIDLFNGLMSPAWPEQEAEQSWRCAVRLYRQTGQGMFVSFGPSSSHPALLMDRVQRDGFRRCAPVPFMHLDLADLQEQSAPDGVRIERIHDFDFFERHEHPWLGSIGAPWRKQKLGFLRQYGEGAAPCLWQFVAFHQRRIVGAATVYGHGEEIALFDVVVVKSHRRRGIGAGLVSAGCDFARKSGMRAAGLSTSKKAVQLYQKVGFTDAGTYQDFYLSREGLGEVEV